MPASCHRCAALLVPILLFAAQALAAEPLVIAHRGASGYLPEHTLAAKALAHAQGADYIESDVVMTRDGVAVVFHDLYLDAMTDVAARFPGRARADGRHYVVDFDYAEIRRLVVHERVRLDDGRPRYPRRFPNGARLFRIHSLADELALIRGLNRSNHRATGVYVEIKAPQWHARHGLDVAGEVIAKLHAAGYHDATDRVFIQCFDAPTLRRIRAGAVTRIPLIQLIGENRWWPDSRTDYDRLRTPAGLREVATYAAGVGPWYRQILLGKTAAGAPRFSSLVADARAAGLRVHPYTLRADALPDFVSGFDELLGYLLREQRVDGVFTDHPDRVRAFLDAN